MTDLQINALSHPLARANVVLQKRHHRLALPWSIILTVNK
jgi:hypothetical protein